MTALIPLGFGIVAFMETRSEMNWLCSTKCHSSPRLTSVVLYQSKLIEGAVETSTKAGLFVMIPQQSSPSNVQTLRIELSLLSSFTVQTC